MSGLSILKRAECQSVKILGLDDLPHQDDDNHVEKVRAVIHGNHRLTVQEVADDVANSV